VVSPADVVPVVDEESALVTATVRVPCVVSPRTHELTEVTMMTVRITARTMMTRKMTRRLSAKKSSRRPRRPPLLRCLRLVLVAERRRTLGWPTLAMLREERLPEMVDARSYGLGLSS